MLQWYWLPAFYVTGYQHFMLQKEWELNTLGSYYQMILYCCLTRNVNLFRRGLGSCGYVQICVALFRFVWWGVYGFIVFYFDFFFLLNFCVCIFYTLYVFLSICISTRITVLEECTTGSSSMRWEREEAGA